MSGPVAITGIGCVSSLGCSAAAFADALLEGRTGFRTLTEFADLPLRAPRAGRVAGYDPSAHIPPLKLRRVDDVGRLTIGAAVEAMQQAGYSRRPEGYDSIGLVLGTSTAGVHASAEYLEVYHHQGAAASPALLFSNTVGNAAASICGLDFGLRGPNTTLMQKEASGLAAIAFGAHLVRRGRVEAILAGGADAIERHFYRVHDWFGVLSPGGADPRPFDAARAGFLMGEGAFLCVLEAPETARARGVTSIATILGTASTASSERVNAWPQEPRALARAMRQAIARADLAPEAIDVVYSSANGTTTLDRVEASAIHEVFGARPVAVTSIKGAIGEFGAAGAASLAAAVLCGARGRVPPVAGLVERAADCPVDASPTARACGPVALVNSFASGGTHVSVVVRIG